jgi:hypothetical protein
VPGRGDRRPEPCAGARRGTPRRDSDGDLWKAYGRHHTVITSHPSVPGVVLTYYDLLDIVKDVSDACVHGGIHFRTDQEGGGTSGQIRRAVELR